MTKDQAARDELLSAYLDDQLDAEDRARLEAQLAGDPALRSELEMLRRTVALVRDWGIPVVQGNVEDQIGSNAGDCGCGFEEGSACAVLSRDWYAASTAALDADVAGWMAARPFLIRFRMEGRRFVVIHAGAERNNQFVFGSTPAEEKARQMDLLGADVVIHSATKYINGHGDALGGAILGSQSFLSDVRECGVVHLGACISPDNAWIFLQGKKKR